MLDAITHGNEGTNVSQSGGEACRLNWVLLCGDDSVDSTALSGVRTYFQYAAQQLSPVRHVGKADTFPEGSAVESVAIVLDLQVNILVISHKIDSYMKRVGVFQYIIQLFLDNAENGKFLILFQIRFPRIG